MTDSLSKPRRHKVFISYHHAGDESHKKQLIRDHGTVFDDYSVSPDDVEDGVNLDEIRRQIRNDYISRATVTIVLVGPNTWKRKHVDWEIHASLRHTSANDRKGLLGLLTPSYQPLEVPGILRYRTSEAGGQLFAPNNIPPRLWDNLAPDVGFALIRPWPRSSDELLEWIHWVFERRGLQPKTTRALFGDNWKGDYWQPLILKS